MRVLAALFAGLLGGALIAFSAANMLAKRNAYGRAAMTMAQHHYQALRDAMQPPCATTAVADTLRRLDAIADEFVPAFPAMRDEPGFALRAEALQKRLAVSRQSPVADCAALNEIVRDINDACEACHNDYR
jgi:hypothetical protein